MKQKAKIYKMSPEDAKKLDEVYKSIIERNPEAERYMAFRESLRKRKRNIFLRLIDSLRLRLLCNKARREFNKR